MRKFLMITTAVYGLSLFTPAISQAQTCKPAPDCADMGYDKSVDDCAGKKMLKCPFNTNFVSCEDGGSEQFLLWEEAVSLPVEEERVFDEQGDIHFYHIYTIPVDGCIIATPATYGGSSYGTVFINDQETDIPAISSSLLCFKGGTQIKREIISNNQWHSFVFIPYKPLSKPNTQCEDGYFYYDDDTCSSLFFEAKNPLGIVVNAELGLVMTCADSSRCNRSNSSYISGMDTPLTNYSSATEALTDINGKTNSDVIEVTFNNSDIAPYFDSRTSLCFDKNDGNKNWFVPAAGQLKNMINKYDLIVNNLQKITYGFLNDYYIATSTEYNRDYMWALDVTTKNLTYISKSQKYSYTMCVFEY